jgi:hypothetical protein
MGLTKLEQLYNEIVNASHEISYDNYPENNIDYSRIVIPFSQIFKSYKPRDIYSGNENIPFKERDVEFKMILGNEFSKL